MRPPGLRIAANQTKGGRDLGAQVEESSGGVNICGPVSGGMARAVSPSSNSRYTGCGGVAGELYSLPDDGQTRTRGVPGGNELPCFIPV